VLLGLAVGGSAIRAEETAKSTPDQTGKEAGNAREKPLESMKGFELYSWVEGGERCFALLQGTNRRKTDAEITAKPTKLVGVAALKQALKKLAKGQSVMWNIGLIVGPDKTGKNTDPSEETQKDIEKACKAEGLKLVLNHC
jgi:hypothetical protein